MPIHSLNQTWLAISWIIDSFCTPAYCWLGSGFKVTGDLQKAIRLGVVFLNLIIYKIRFLEIISMFDVNQ